MPVVHSEGFCHSLTDQSVEFNRNQQTSTDHSKKLNDLCNTVHPQSLDSNDAAMVKPRKDHNLRQSARARLDDIDHTGQTVPDHAEGLYLSREAQPGPAECHHTTKPSEDQVDSRVNSGQRPSTQCAETHYIEQAPTVQSEEIYLSRTCDSHWSDSVTANKLAVEGDLNG